MQVRAEESATAAQDVQARFVIVVQAVDSYSVPEQAEEAHAVHPRLLPASPDSY